MTLLMMYVLFLHWLADFICQTQWMALNKSKNNVALTTHVAVYSLVMLFGLFIVEKSILIFAFVAINFFAHWLTDYCTSRLTSRFFAAGQINYFWWVIGGDQLLHVITLGGLVNWLF